MGNLEIRGYSQEAYSELGGGADKRLTEDIIRDITVSWNTVQAQFKQPVAILIGGFQGSGKTTTIKAFNSDLQLPVISSDEIRYQLLQRSISPSDKEFNPQVFAVRNSLISLVGQERASFILDQIITPVRASLVENLLKNNNGVSYAILKILLIAPLEVLRKRVSTRSPLQYNYRGTLEELESTISKYGSFELSRFQKVFNTEEFSPDVIAGEIKQMLKTLEGQN